MRVLTVYDGRRSTARRLQIDFLKCLDEYCTFMTYGPQEHETDPELAPLEFDTKLTIEDVVNKLEPDIILHYQSLVAKKAIKYIKGFDKLKIPQVMLEVDYHDVEDKGWYRENKMELLIYRGWYAPIELKLAKLPFVWLPHAASAEFYTTGEERYNKFVFAGSGRYSANILYRIRQHTIRILEGANLLDWVGNVGYEPFPGVLRSYTCAFTDACGTMVSPIGKTFEIMGSGTALLSQHFEGENVLFGEKPPITFIQDNVSDAKRLATKMLENPEKTANMAKRGLRIINKQHRYTHRAYELYQILLAVAGGTKVPRKWGC